MQRHIIKLQNRAIRIITNSANDVSVGPLLRQIQLPSISDMIKQESAGMLYKAYMQRHLYTLQNSLLESLI